MTATAPRNRPTYLKDERTLFESWLDFPARYIFHHMIQEYARHNGHADLIREMINGTTGL